MSEHLQPMLGFLRSLVIVLITVFAIVMITLWATQDRFLFLPVADAATPKQTEITVQSIATNDNETLVAWYVEASAGCPTLLQFHGNGGHLSTEFWRHERLLKAGVGFLALSWRGYAGSTGKPSEKGFHVDARAAWEWLIEQGLAPNDILIQAHSIGSGPAIRLAAETNPGALILEAPFFSMKDLISRKVPALPTGTILKHPFRSDLYIADVSAPLLIVHGTKDSVIPIEQSKRLFELASEPKTYVSLPESDHNTLVRDGLFDHVWPFIAANWTSTETNIVDNECFLASQSGEQI